MNRETILREIETADMILIGLGEEFNNRRTVRDNVRYKRMYEKIEKSAFPWLIPALNRYWNPVCATIPGWSSMPVNR